MTRCPCLLHRDTSVEAYDCSLTSILPLGRNTSKNNFNILSCMANR